MTADEALAAAPWGATLRRGVVLGIAGVIVATVIFLAGYCTGARQGPPAPGQAVLDSLTAQADSLDQLAVARWDSLQDALAEAARDSAAYEVARARVRVVSPGVVEIRDPASGMAPRVEQVAPEITARLEADDAHIASQQRTIAAALLTATLERQRADTQRARADTAIAQRDAERRSHRAREIKQGAVLLGVGALLGILLGR